MARPRPLPPERARAASALKKRSKTCGRTSGSMPGPWSATSIRSRPDVVDAVSRTGAPPCRSALPTRLATTTSIRRGSRRTRRSSGRPVSTWSCQPRNWSVLRRATATSISSRSRSAAPASKRETSIRSSTMRASLLVSSLIRRTASAVSGSSRAASSSRTSVTADMAASGVRSSWETSAAKRRALASMRRSSASSFSRARAISLNVTVRSASSSRPVTGERVSSSPEVMRSAASRRRRTGSSTRRAANSAGTTASASAGSAPAWAAVTRAEMSACSSSRANSA